MMNYPFLRILRFLLTVLSGILFWIFKGFKTILNDELGDQYFARNLIASSVLMSLVFLLVYFNSQSSRREDNANFNIRYIYNPETKTMTMDGAPDTSFHISDTSPKILFP
jgi:hypothetical protein